MGLTAVILTNKEPKDITPTANSVDFADEVLLVRDGTGKEKQIGNTKIIFNKLNSNFSDQRNLGLSRAKNDWVLFVDDDETVSKELADEIKQASRDENISGYYLKRIDRYHDQVLHHGETGNIKIVRLGRRSSGKFDRPVHEIWQIKGKVGVLNNSLIHERGDLVSTFVDRMAFYGPIDAKELTKENKPFTYWRCLLNPKGKFLANYFLKLGFLDGLLGLFQAYLMGVQSLTVRVFQWRKI